MREWFVLSPTSKKRWPALAKQAMDFVGGKSGDKNRRACSTRQFGMRD
jgi:hypothetical protein